MDFLDQIFHQNVNIPKESIVAITWGVWKKRCEIRHSQDLLKRGNVSISSQQVKWVLNMVEEFANARTTIDKARKRCPFKKLGSKSEDELLIFTDASYIKITRESAYGVVITDRRGQLQQVASGNLGTLESPLEAKLAEIAEGIRMAKMRGKGKFVILTDCLQAIFAIKNNECCFGQSGYTLQQIRNKMVKGEEWRFEHIHRDYNGVAHLLAKNPRTPADSPDWVSTKVHDWLRTLQSHLC